MTITQAELNAIGNGAVQIAAINDEIRAIGNAIRAIGDGVTAHYNTPAGFAVQAALYHVADKINGGGGVTPTYDDVVTALRANQGDWGALIQNDLTAANNVASALTGVSLI